MPGDDLVPGCQYCATRAITIGAPPDEVWPWLVQTGFGKAGFYSNDLLDNAGHPSADHVLVDLQVPRVGDWVPMFAKVNDRTAFKVAAVEPGRQLLWSKPDSTWSWRLTPVAGGTRLITRLRHRYRWDRPGDAVLSLLLNEFGDFPMMRKMLLTLKQRAEGRSRESTRPFEYRLRWRRRGGTVTVSSGSTEAFRRNPIGMTATYSSWAAVATGGALAHDLSLRGLRVTLVELGELTSGTTCRHDGMLHTAGATRSTTVSRR